MNMNKRLVLVMVMLVTAAWAQDKSTALTQAGCGPDPAKFEVKRDAHSHPTGTPQSGKALVYVFGDSELDNAAIQIGGLITRVGMDGAWVGAYEHKSYTYFSVEPGEHRLCTSQQSSLKSRRQTNASAITFTAEQGKVYYFRTQPDPTALSQSAVSRAPSGRVELTMVDPAQAQLMVLKWAYSTSQPKK
jgi:hypothetical protein